MNPRYSMMVLAWGCVKMRWPFREYRSARDGGVEVLNMFPGTNHRLVHLTYRCGIQVAALGEGFVAQAG